MADSSNEIEDLRRKVEELQAALAEADDALQDANFEARKAQLQKQQAIETFAGGVAHAFNNLLMPIMGYADMLEQEAEPGSETMTTSRSIGLAVRRASDLATQLLSFARKAKLQSRNVNLHRIISSTVARMGRAMDKRIKVSLLMEADSPVVQGDATQIQSVVANLAENACCAMTGGGELGFHTENVDLDADDARRAPEMKAGRYLRLSVKDTGAGMSEEVRRRALEPFFTTKGEGESAGMGLAMVQGMVAMHGGCIELSSKEGEGTLVQVYLPATGEGRIQEPARPGAPASRGALTVLVIEDEDSVRHTLAAMLTSLGYGVVLTADGKEGLEYYRENGTKIDLVVLDLTMPVMDGQECFRELKRIDPKVKAVVATGHARDGLLAREVMDEGALQFIQKPFVKAELARAVSKALRGSCA